LQVQVYTNSSLIPSLQTGDPFTLGENGTAGSTNMKAVFGKFAVADATGYITATTSYQTGETVSKFSEVALLDPQEAAPDVTGILFDFDINYNEFFKTVKDTRTAATTRFHGTNLVNIDLTGFNATGNYDIYLVNSSSRIITDNDEGAVTASNKGTLQIAQNASPKSITSRF
jgi:hypothetical protein